jgi:hypothetical protein
MGAAAVVTLLAGYVGLYYATVSPRHAWALPTLPDYGAAQPVAEVLFWPVHRIDRKLRPEAWKGFRDIDDGPSIRY